MKKNFLTIGMIITAFALGFGINNFAMSDTPSKIAVIEVSKIARESKEMIAIQKEQDKKLIDMKNWVTKAREDVQKQTNEEAKKKLEKKYDAEFAKKRTENHKEFTDKIVKVNKKINDVIEKEAKTNGYDVVLAKGAVVYGGQDITTTVLEKLNK